MENENGTFEALGTHFTEKTTNREHVKVIFVIITSPSHLVPVPEEEHGVLQEQDGGYQSQVTKPERKGEEVDVEQREVQEEHLV